MLSNPPRYCLCLFLELCAPEQIPPCALGLVWIPVGGSGSVCDTEISGVSNIDALQSTHRAAVSLLLAPHLVRATLVLLEQAAQHPKRK